MITPSVAKLNIFRPETNSSITVRRQPGGFWPTRFPYNRLCPAQGNFRDTSLIYSQYEAQPSDSTAFDFHNNALETSFSVKVPILDIIVEGLKFAHVRLDDTPALRAV